MKKDVTFPKYCLWGHIDTIKTITSGIHFVSTPSHGGYRLDRKRKKEFYKKFPDFIPFNPRFMSYFEEDDDWCVVHLAFPEYFPTTQKIAFEAAKSMLTSQYSCGRVGSALKEFLKKNEHC